MKTNNTTRYVTCVGTAEYPWLSEPDTKFDPDGVYKVNMVFANVTPDFQYVIDDLAKILNDYYQAIVDDPKNARIASKVTIADLYEEDEQGAKVFKFKQKAVIKSSKGTFNVKIPIFDSKGHPLTGCKIGGGSKLKVCFSAAPYFVQSTKVCGLTLRPVAIQVIELKEYADGSSMEAYGFGEEDGYERQEEEAPFEDFSNEGNNF